MPELPEVEHARVQLTKWLRGAPRVVAVKVHDARILGGRLTPRSFAAALRGRALGEVQRRGKWLRIALDDGRVVFSHFGMTGKWVRRPHDEAAARFERARIDVDGGMSLADPPKAGGGMSLRYLDPRLFGRLLVSREDIAAWRALGPDPLVDGVDVNALAKKLAARKKSVKEALMDQGVLAGIGNIQATEALFRARVDPETRADRLTRPQISAIARGIRASIAFTLAREDMDEITYVEEAGAANPFLVYGREGEPCPRCKAPLARIVQGGRSTTYCASCQT